MNTTYNNNLPTLSNEGGLSTYLDQIKKFPMLDAEDYFFIFCSTDFGLHKMDWDNF